MDFYVNEIKIKKGDKVKIKENLIVDSRYNQTCRYTKKMDQLKGKTLEVKEVLENEYHGPRIKLKLKEEPGKYERYVWTTEMIKEIININEFENLERIFKD